MEHTEVRLAVHARRLKTTFKKSSAKQTSTFRNTLAK